MSEPYQNFRGRKQPGLNTRLGYGREEESQRTQEQNPEKGQKKKKHFTVNQGQWEVLQQNLKHVMLLFFIPLRLFHLVKCKQETKLEINLLMSIPQWNFF